MRMGEQPALGACPRIGTGRVLSAARADARRRAAGDVGVHRRGPATTQMPVRRRNPKGAWGLRAHTSLLVVDDVQRHRLLLAPCLRLTSPTRATPPSSRTGS